MNLYSAAADDCLVSSLPYRRRVALAVVDVVKHLLANCEATLFVACFIDVKKRSSENLKNVKKRKKRDKNKKAFVNVSLLSVV